MEAVLFPRINLRNYCYTNGLCFYQEKLATCLIKKSSFSWLASYFDNQGKVKACNPDLNLDLAVGISNGIYNLILLVMLYNVLIISSVRRCLLSLPRPVGRAGWLLGMPRSWAR